MTDRPLRVVFAGTPEFAAAHLQAIIGSDHHLCAVYTQPDRPAGRGRNLTASPVKRMAIEQNLLVCQPETLKTADARQTLSSFNPDIMVIVAYGIILPSEVLEIPKYGCINVHASLLPRWRGAAPIQRAIEAGDDSTGVTIMQMDEGLDTGDMLLRSSVEITTSETSDSLHNRLMAEGARLLLEALELISQGNITAEKQDNKFASYAHKLTKADAAIDWSLSADEIGRKIRAYNPWPGSTVSLDQQQMKVIAEPRSIEDSLSIDETIKPGTIVNAGESGLVVACDGGSLLIKALQLPGKKMTPISALLNAYQDRFRADLRFDQ